MEVPIEQVVPDPSQPRKDWGHNDGPRHLTELAESIREFGILQPLLVREEGTIRDGRQRYIIIAGARRRTAAEQANLATVPVVLRGEQAARIRVLQLIENLQRQELSPLDEARAFQELLDMEGLTPPALAERLHLSAQHVRDRLRVLADQVLADAVERRQIPPSVARDIMKLPDEGMEGLRSRVQAGERVQLNDVAETRARLEASGVVNPRRKTGRAGTPSTSALPGGSRWGPEASGPRGHVTPVEAAGASSAVEEQTVFVRDADVVPLPVANAQHNANEQTLFVKSPQAGRVITDGENPAPSSDLSEVADRLSILLDSGLNGALRNDVLALLAGPYSDQLWCLTQARLRALLERSA
jgi:ParB family chromosome partitioning protein